MSLDRPEVIRNRLVTVHDLDQLMIEIDDWIADYAKLGRELGFPRVRGGGKSIFADLASWRASADRNRRKAKLHLPCC